jgi:hypothetical protein
VETGEVEIQRCDGTTDIIGTLLRPLPRNGGSVRLLTCPGCLAPRRGLYGWELDEDGRFNTSVARSNWRCRACHKLRYASEGGALVLRGRGAIARMFGRSHCDRPKPWLPDFFTSPEERRKRTSEQSQETRHVSGYASRKKTRTKSTSTTTC